mmetsp:Transcript_12524/g.18244  ORF Transcript_12524/g.18244 Transcript_12524/m.18244 type:complete len:87 (-) Transcript_12524:8-268(-)
MSASLFSKKSLVDDGEANANANDLGTMLVVSDEAEIAHVEHVRGIAEFWNAAAPDINARARVKPSLWVGPSLVVLGIVLPVVTLFL